MTTTWRQCYVCRNIQSLHMLIEYNGRNFCLGNPSCLEKYLAGGMDDERESQSGEQTDEERESE